MGKSKLKAFLICVVFVVSMVSSTSALFSKFGDSKKDKGHDTSQWRDIDPHRLRSQKNTPGMVEASASTGQQDQPTDDSERKFERMTLAYKESLDVLSELAEREAEKQINKGKYVEYANARLAGYEPNEYGSGVNYVGQYQDYAGIAPQEQPKMDTQFGYHHQENVPAGYMQQLSQGLESMNMMPPSGNPYQGQNSYLSSSTSNTNMSEAYREYLNQFKDRPLTAADLEHIAQNGPTYGPSKKNLYDTQKHQENMNEVKEYLNQGKEIIQMIDDDDLWGDQAALPPSSDHLQKEKEKYEEQLFSTLPLGLNLSNKNYEQLENYPGSIISPSSEFPPQMVPTEYNQQTVSDANAFVDEEQVSDDSHKNKKKFRWHK